MLPHGREVAWEIHAGFGGLPHLRFGSGMSDMSLPTILEPTRKFLVTEHSSRHTPDSSEETCQKLNWQPPSLVSLGSANSIVHCTCQQARTFVSYHAVELLINAFSMLLSKAIRRRSSLSYELAQGVVNKGRFLCARKVGKIVSAIPCEACFESDASTFHSANYPIFITNLPKIPSHALQQWR